MSYGGAEHADKGEGIHRAPTLYLHCRSRVVSAVVGYTINRGKSYEGRAYVYTVGSFYGWAIDRAVSWLDYKSRQCAGFLLSILPRICK